MIAFGIFYILKSFTISNNEKYPPSTDCASIIDMFGSDFDDTDFREFAGADKNPTMDGKGTGIYYCFCKNYDGNLDKPDYCDDYTYDYLIALALGKVVSFAIVIINTILRTIVMMLIKYIGFYTESEQTLNIKSSIFVTQFFNTAILLLLTGANT